MKTTILKFSIALTLILNANNIQAQYVSTYAGSGVLGNTNGAASVASFTNPTGLVLDKQGNLFVADNEANLIRKITPSGIVSTFAGNGTQGSVDGIGTAASFYKPFGLAIDSMDNIFVADCYNNEIRKITPAGVVSTFAGNTNQGAANGQGTAATFFKPTDVTIDKNGNLYVPDYGNLVIRKITAAGMVSTYAGTTGVVGTTDGLVANSLFYYPYGICIDKNDNLFITDAYNSTIRKITAAGVVSTYAGNGAATNVNGNATTASFYRPSFIAVDAAENVYVTDANSNAIRIITPAGNVSNYAGDINIAGNTNGIDSLARFQGPTFLRIDATNNNMYVSDGGNYLIRKIGLNPLALNNTTANTTKIGVYPNPTTNDVQIMFQLANAGTVALQIMDINSKLLSTQNIYSKAGTNMANISLQGMANGLYLLKIVQNGQLLSTQKLVKE